MNRKLWLDKRGTPVITTTPNGERNAIRWGWTPRNRTTTTNTGSGGPHPRPPERTRRSRMKITITIETSDNEPPVIEAGPQGTDALIEHADHDSTPRILGFNPQPPLEEE